ncbi:MAG TPA: zinc ribbon domain-containing protein [Gemmatimonadales bacterium]
MALAECPECGTVASTEATFCPRCGYPISKAGDPEPSGPRGLPFVAMNMLEITRSIVGRILVGAGMMATGIVFDAPPGVLLALVTWGSVVPLYLKARKAHRLGPLAGQRQLEEAVKKQLTAARDETERQLANVEHHTGRIAELEERVDFLERLLARERGRERPAGGERQLP